MDKLFLKDIIEDKSKQFFSSLWRISRQDLTSLIAY